jgi:AAA+ ATPase superfamily predicted ATPase
MKFIGRYKELDELEQLLKKQSASLVVIRGRRRVGKTRLIKEFVSDKKSWLFEGPTPDSKMNKQRQLDNFSKQVSERLSLPKMQATEWSEYFNFLAGLAKGQRLVIVFDEISWMGSEDPDFLGQLKTAWDQHFSSNSELILILCGSVSSWIEENILRSTGFVGRISLDIELNELSIAESGAFWGAQKNHVSAYEKLKMLAVTGGIPKYLEEMHPDESSDANIHQLCFQKSGFLFREFDHIFEAMFLRRSENYRSLVSTLSSGPLTLDEICKKLNLEKSGSVSRCLDDLALAGFIQEDYTWNISTEETSRLKKFRLKDNYLRFYLRYIEPNKNRIEQGYFPSQSIMQLPEMETVMGLQFENLVINNIKSLCRILRIELLEIVNAGPFFQRKTNRQKGCQIDLLIQTRHNTLYVCEIKFSVSEVPASVIHEVETKLDRLSVPKEFSIRPVLIHVNGISQKVRESEFFSSVIDFSQFFDQKSDVM